MCDPVSLGLGNLALGVASAGGGFMSSLMGGAQTRASATENAMQNAAMTAERMRQERIASATKIFQMAKEATAAESATRNRASEMGVSGNTVMRLIGDLQGQEAEREHIVEQNSNNVVQQLAMGAKAGFTRMDQQIASSGSMAGALGSLALGLGKAGLSAYNAYEAADNKGASSKKFDGLLALLKSKKNDTEDDT